MPRFFIEGISPKPGDRITLSEEDSRHVSLSLRMKRGDALTLCDGRGTDFGCVAVDFAGAVTVEVVSSSPSAGEPPYRATVFQAEIKGDKFDIYISDAFITDILSSGGEEYTYPSTIKVYTFKLNVNSIEGGNVSIVSAVFAPNGSDERFEALDGSYSSIKAGETSLIGKPLSPGTSGVLFFEIYNPEEEGITYEGKIYLQLSDRAEQIEITTRF